MERRHRRRLRAPRPLRAPPRRRPRRPPARDARPPDRLARRLPDHPARTLLQAATRARLDGADSTGSSPRCCTTSATNSRRTTTASSRPPCCSRTSPQRCTGSCQHHGVFQSYYYAHHLGGDRNARDQFADHRWAELCEEFCARWDQNSFDPDFPIHDRRRRSTTRCARSSVVRRGPRQFVAAGSGRLVAMSGQFPGRVGFIGLGNVGRQARRLAAAQRRRPRRFAISTARLRSRSSTGGDRGRDAPRTRRTVRCRDHVPAVAGGVGRGDGGRRRCARRPPPGMRSGWRCRPPTPVEIARLAARVAVRASTAVDCPVSGGCHRAATRATSRSSPGCDRATFERVLPLLTMLGRRVLHTGELGIGLGPQGDDELPRDREPRVGRDRGA